LAAPFCTNVLK